MELKTAINDRQQTFDAFAEIDDDRLTRQRLDSLLALNGEITREKSLFLNERERFEASLMKSPLSTVKSYSYFGAMLGIFPPFALFSRFIFSRPFHSEDYWLVPLLVFVNIVCACAGYYSGKLIGRIVTELEKLSWTKMLLALPFVGIFWGILTGGSGGIFIFLIGAFFGALIAAAVGSLAIPTYTVFHRLLKRGDQIEEKHFFPLALGISCIITAFILGL